MAFGVRGNTLRRGPVAAHPNASMGLNGVDYDAVEGILHAAAAAEVAHRFPDALPDRAERDLRQLTRNETWHRLKVAVDHSAVPTVSPRRRRESDSHHRGSRQECQVHLGRGTEADTIDQGIADSDGATE